MMRYFMVTLLLLSCATVHAQQDSVRMEDLRAQILELQADVDYIQLNLNQSRKRFTRGIIVATIGYTVTITGGLMLGRKNDDLGKALLITGGTVGAIGTVMLIDSFRYMGRARKKDVSSSH